MAGGTLPTPEDLDALRGLDTPTVCNALEIVAPDRRGGGYTVAPFFCPRPFEPMVGYARTGTMRAMEPSPRSAEEDAEIRIGYYAHIAAGPGPTITVIEDLDPVPGYGAWWGEVNTSLHQGLGSLGVITNGSVRDLDDVAPGFHLLAGMPGPSHAFVRIEEYGIPVTVHGMTVQPRDLIHADRHGAVVIPPEAAGAVFGAAAAIAAEERVLIEASRQPGFDLERLRKLLESGPGH